MNYDFYGDMNVINDYMGFNNIKELNLFNPYEGYLKGNSFKNEYIPYKNYRVQNIDINNKKDEMLINIGEYSFIMHDLNLYLDVYPDNQEALNKFNEYRNKTNELITKYERKYGPLAIKGDVSNNTPFNWIVKWPWGN